MGQKLTKAFLISVFTTLLLTVPSVAQGDGNWSTNAMSFRGRIGERLTVYCKPTATIPPVWGTDLYTDDSSVCAAGVHAGALKSDEGGSVTIEIRKGMDQYVGSPRNGIESFSYRAWEGSFAVVLPPNKRTIGTRSGVSVVRRRADWNSTIAEFRGRLGTRVLISCPAAERLTGGVWGSDVYADDSPVCLAGVHAGAITPAGGTMVVEIAAGLRNYFGTTSNGVKSHSYGAWDGSFVVLRDGLKDLANGNDCVFTASSNPAEVQINGLAARRGF